jgi:hypothetical protein
MDRRKVWILVDRTLTSLLTLLFMVSHFVPVRPDLNVQSQYPNIRPSRRILYLP